MIATVEYSGMFGPVCRAFATPQRAEQWARQSGVYGRARIGRDIGELRFYRLRAWRGRWPLFPCAPDSIHCGRFLNAQHFHKLLKLWSGCGGGPDRIRYEYSTVDTEQSESFEVIDHTGSMPHYARPEFADA